MVRANAQLTQLTRGRLKTSREGHNNAKEPARLDLHSAWCSTPAKSNSSFDNDNGAAPKFRIMTARRSGAATGPSGRVSCLGETRTGDCSLAQTLTIKDGTSVDEVFNLSCWTTVPRPKGGTAVISRANSFPGRTVFRTASKDRLVQLSIQTSTGPSRWFRTRRTLVSFVGAPRP